MRAADADREATAERLRNAVADGRLGLDELDERLAATYAAKTHAELDAVTSDLPTPANRSVRPLHLKTKSGTLKRTGYWTVPASITAECTSGTIKLDFTAADCPHDEVHVRARATSGSIVMIVPHGWSVEMDSASTSSGSLVNRVAGSPALGGTVLRVDGEVRSGTIKARHPRRSFWDWLLRR